MDYYKILDIDENASKDEIRQAYHKQVNRFKNEVKDPKMLEKFLDLFKTAYDELCFEENEEKVQVFDDEISSLFKSSNIEYKEENDIVKCEVKEDISNTYAATILMSREDILKESLNENKESKQEEKIIFKSKEDFEDGIGFFDHEDEYEEISVKKNKPKNKSKYKNKKSENKKKNVCKKELNSEENNEKEKKKNENINMKNEGKVKGKANKRVIVKKEKNSNNILSLLLIPIKILALPIIIILSIIIFICRIISMASWLVSKIIIILAIAISSIHGYEIYKGYEVANYELFILCGIGAIVSMFLPSIVRVIPNMLTGINESLKSFVF